LLFVLFNEHNKDIFLQQVYFLKINLKFLLSLNFWLFLQRNIQKILQIFIYYCANIRHLNFKIFNRTSPHYYPFYRFRTHIGLYALRVSVPIALKNKIKKVVRLISIWLRLNKVLKPLRALQSIFKLFLQCKFRNIVNLNLAF